MQGSVKYLLLFRGGLSLVISDLQGFGSGRAGLRSSWVGFISHLCIPSETSVD